jgi:hypothetical protein
MVAHAFRFSSACVPARFDVDHILADVVHFTFCEAVEGNVSEITPMAGQRKPLRHQATEVAADDQPANTRVAGVAFPSPD